MEDNLQVHSYQEEVGTYFDLFAEKHMDKGDQNPILTDMRNSFRQFVQHPAPKNILDIGCGPGQDVAFFATKYPDANVYGIDVSAGMIKCAHELAQKMSINNTHYINTGIEELENHIESGTKFDIITVFFGALNTVSSLQQSAQIIQRLLKPGGVAMLSFVNKYYMAEFFINAAKGNMKNATARWGKTWRGYSPEVALASKTYTPTDIQSAFRQLTLQTKRGYSIFYPAWFQSKLLMRSPGLCKVLYKIDKVINKTPLWKYGEYTLFVYRKPS